MNELHPDKDALECFARGEIVAETERWILDHLRMGCPVCQPTIDALLPCLDAPPALPILSGESSQPFHGPDETDSTDLTRPRLPGGSFPGRLASAASPASQRNAGAGAWSPGSTAAVSASRRKLQRQAAVAGARRGRHEDKDVDNAAWDRIFAKVEQRLVLVAAECAAAPRLLGELLQRPPAEWSTLVHASRSLQSLALCDLLLDRSFETGGYDCTEAIALAQLGILVADHLDVRHYGSAVVHDMKARAWAYLGNARRLAADFGGAEQALAFAEALSEDGSADPLEEARLLDLKASLLSDQGWFEEAAELLDTVIEIFEDVQDLHRKGRALIGKGVCLGRSGWPQPAVELVLQGLALLDREVEPRLALTARHELAWYLAECGHCDHAQRQLDSVRKGLMDGDDARTELRMEWLEARIAHRSGRWPEAEHRLGQLVQRCVAAGLGYEAALVMLDLASLHFEQGKRVEIRRLAEDVLPTVLSLDVHRQAAAALVTFQQAARDDRVTRALVSDIAAYLQRARKNPRLSFQLAA